MRQHAVSLCVVLAVGCASPVTPSGFLGDYSTLKPLSEDPAILYFEKPNVDWKPYAKLFFDPLVVYYSPDARNRQIDPAELNKLTDYFYRAVVDAVKDAYPIVSKREPGVLRIRAAITDLVPASPAVNVVTTAAVMIPLDMGGAAMEAEFLDAVTNERLAAIVDRKKALPLSPREFIAGFTTWGHAKIAFDRWAKELRQALDEVHGKR